MGGLVRGLTMFNAIRNRMVKKPYRPHREETACESSSQILSARSMFKLSKNKIKFEKFMNDSLCSESADEINLMTEHYSDRRIDFSMSYTR